MTAFRLRERGARVAVPVLAILLTGCGGGDGASDSTGLAAESAGTTGESGDGDATGDPDSTGDGDATGSGDGDGDGDGDAAPEVREDATYSVTVTELSIWTANPEEDFSPQPKNVPNAIRTTPVDKV